jgi:type-2 restriction enzyme ngoPII
MSNIIDAIYTLLSNKQTQIKEYQNVHNRINSVGDSLENFVADLFYGSVNETDKQARLKRHNEIFSYIGNNSNPPDFMLKNGDAIEVKKIENFNSALALNSSYPKAKLYSNSSMITSHCKECEAWNEKDMIYAVGVMSKNYLKSLVFVYGEDYAASSEIYERIKNTIKSGVESINGVEFAITNELGRVNRVDPLGITYLRIRGMWHIQNPLKTFEYVYKRDESKKFSFMSIINDEKFSSFENRNKLLNLINKTYGAKISDVLIKNPNNPAKLKSAKLITYEF